MKNIFTLTLYGGHLYQQELGDMFGGGGRVFWTSIAPLGNKAGAPHLQHSSSKGIVNFGNITESLGPILGDALLKFDGPN